MQKTNFLLLKKFKNTENAQLWIKHLIKIINFGANCPVGRNGLTNQYSTPEIEPLSIFIFIDKIFFDIYLSKSKGSFLDYEVKFVTLFVKTKVLRSLFFLTG